MHINRIHKKKEKTKNIAKLTLFTMLVFAMIQLASAELILNPSQITQNTIVGQEYLIPITFQNTFNFTIYNISLQSNQYVTMPQIPNIQPNSQVQENVKIITDSQFPTQNLQLVTSFLYITAHSQDPQSYFLNITNSGLAPSSITLKQGDNLRIFNARNVTQTFLEDDGLFQQDISPGQEITLTFSSTNYPPNDYNFHTSPSFYGITIKVLNSSSQDLTHNTDYDKLLGIDLTSNFPSTSLQLTIIDNNLTVLYNGVNEGLLKITNNGNKTAKNITLISDKWIFFNKQNFDLNPTANSFVTYKILPIITKVEETNVNYSIPIKIQSLNTDEVKSSISFFIPYEPNLVVSNLTNLTREELIQRIESLIKALEIFKTLPSDNQTIIYRESNVSLQGAPNDLRSLAEDNRATKDAVERTEKIINDKIANLDKNIANLSETTNSVSSVTIENQKSIKTLYQWLLIVFILGILALGLKQIRDRGLKILRRKDIEGLEGIR